MESWFQVYIRQSPGQLSMVQFLSESSMMNQFIDLLQFTSQQQQLSDHNSLKLFILVKTLVSIDNRLIGMMSNFDPRNIGPLVSPQRNFGPFHCVVASCVVAPPTRGKSSSHQLVHTSSMLSSLHKALLGGSCTAPVESALFTVY